MFDQSKRGRQIGRKQQQAIENNLRRAMFDIKLMATDDVARAYDRLVTGFTGESGSDEEAARRLVDLFGGLLLAMRKDLGNPATTLTELEMLRLIITDVDDYYLPSGDG